MVSFPMRIPFNLYVTMSDALEEKSRELWELEYARRIEQDVMDGMVEMPKPDDRRKDPRLQLRRGKNIWIHTDRVPVPILNISKSGVAFFSEQQYFPGDHLHLSVANTLTIKARVLECEMEETDAIFMEYRYHVRAKFDEGENGCKIYVLARDIYRHDLDKPFTTYRLN